jgi:hypothetical protein
MNIHSSTSEENNNHNILTTHPWLPEAVLILTDEWEIVYSNQQKIKQKIDRNKQLLNEGGILPEVLSSLGKPLKFQSTDKQFILLQQSSYNEIYKKYVVDVTTLVVEDFASQMAVLSAIVHEVLTNAHIRSCVSKLYVEKYKSNRELIESGVQIPAVNACTFWVTEKFKEDRDKLRFVITINVENEHKSAQHLILHPPAKSKHQNTQTDHLSKEVQLITPSTANSHDQTISSNKSAVDNITPNNHKHTLNSENNSEQDSIKRQKSSKGRFPNPHNQYNEQTERDAQQRATYFREQFQQQHQGSIFTVNDKKILGNNNSSSVFSNNSFSNNHDTTTSNDIALLANQIKKQSHTSQSRPTINSPQPQTHTSHQTEPHSHMQRLESNFTTFSPQTHNNQHTDHNMNQYNNSNNTTQINNSGRQTHYQYSLPQSAQVSQQFQQNNQHIQGQQQHQTVYNQQQTSNNNHQQSHNQTNHNQMQQNNQQYDTQINQQQNQSNNNFFRNQNGWN